MQDCTIKNEARFRQQVKFDKVAGMQATDIDYFCDIKGKAFIYAELKCKGAKMPKGQEIAAENLCKSSRIPVFFILLEHDTDPEDDIIAAEAKVAKIWFSKGDGILHTSTNSKGKEFAEVKATIERWVFPV